MMKRFLSNMSFKLRLFLPILVGVIVIAFVVAFLSVQITEQNINKSIKRTLRQEVDILTKMFERERALKLEKVKSDLKVARSFFEAKDFYVSDQQITMKITNQVNGNQHKERLDIFYLHGKKLIDNYSFVDDLQRMLGGTVTIFQKADSGYVRVSTNVPKKDGSRAVGTYIPSHSPVIQAIEKGETYFGRAYVVNDWYVTAYDPIYYNDEIVGILYVGDKEKNLSELQKIFSKISIGKTGYSFVFDSKGNIVIPSSPKDNITQKSHIIKEIKQYEENKKEFLFKIKGGERIVAFNFFEDFKLYVVAVIIPHEETKEVRQQIIKNIIITGVVVVILFLIFVYFVTTENVHKYLRELELSNKKLKIARDALEQTEKLATMGQLSAGIAHAVSNPLGVITMHTHILKEEVNEESTIYSDLELIAEQSERCKKVLSGLLNFARTSEVVYQETNINEMIDIIKDEIDVPGNIDFKVLNKVKNPIAFFDTRQVIQALKHLLNNAIEAAKENGKVVFEIETLKDIVRFIVADNGPGIPQEHQNKLFEPFFTTKEANSGAGLGLAVSYGIIKMHRGKIKVESDQDKNKGDTGTKIIVEIPNSEETAKK